MITPEQQMMLSGLHQVAVSKAEQCVETYHANRKAYGKAVSAAIKAQKKFREYLEALANGKR